MQRLLRQPTAPALWAQWIHSRMAVWKCVQAKARDDQMRKGWRGKLVAQSQTTLLAHHALDAEMVKMQIWQMRQAIQSACSYKFKADLRLFFGRVRQRRCLTRGKTAKRLSRSSPCLHLTCTRTKSDPPTLKGMIEYKWCHVCTEAEDSEKSVYWPTVRAYRQSDTMHGMHVCTEDGIDWMNAGCRACMLLAAAVDLHRQEAQALPARARECIDLCKGGAHIGAQTYGKPKISDAIQLNKGKTNLIKEPNLLMTHRGGQETSCWDHLLLRQRFAHDHAHPGRCGTASFKNRLAHMAPHAPQPCCAHLHPLLQRLRTIPKKNLFSSQQEHAASIGRFGKLKLGCSAAKALKIPAWSNSNFLSIVACVLSR